MAGIRLHAGNRMEALAEALAREVDAPLADPFAKERIIVPNRGVGRWLSLFLAEKNSVFANFSFPNPDGFFEEVHSSLFPGEPRQVFSLPRGHDLAAYEKDRRAAAAPLLLPGEGVYAGGGDRQRRRTLATLSALRKARSPLRALSGFPHPAAEGVGG